MADQAVVAAATVAASQRELRQRLLTVETAIAAELDRFEHDTGLRVIRIDLPPFASGHKPILRAVPPEVVSRASSKGEVDGQKR